MKKFLLATLCILIGVLAFAQAPQKISYQAVIRNNNGNLVTNQQVSLRISIMKNGGTTGQIDQPIVNRSIVAIYTETHTVTTNANGLATIEIGGGVTSDNFATIDWSNGTYYLKTSVDLTGRGRYEVMGMSQLISVPYAMYAQKAGSAVTETDPQFNAWDKDYNDLTNRPEIPVVPTNVSAFTNDANYITFADVPAQVNADWNATSGAGQILNKPEIPTIPTNVSAFANDANYITSADVPAQVNADWNATSGAGQILNKPELFSGNYNDLTNKPAIPTVPTNVSAFTNDANYITSADVLAQVNADWNATSGAGQILNKPEIPTVPTNVSAFTNDANYITSADVPAQVNADWNATSGAGQILNKPAIPTVPTNVSAFTNDANYITSADVPAQVNADWNATSGAGQILNKPEIPTVPTNVSAFTNDANYITSADVPAQVNADWNATSGARQILNKPEIPTVPTNVSAFTNDANYITSADVPAQVNADWNATSGAGQILNKPEIPTVPTNVSAFTNDANYITSADVPAQVNADWNATSGAGQILNKPELFSGDYNDLANRPEIPTVPTNVSAFTNDANYITSADVPAQVNADWNATSGAGQILNKPEIPTVPTNVSAFTNDANYITSADVPAQVNADWNATSGAGQILNKPELFSGDYNDLANRPEIPTVPTNVSAFTNDANYITSADVPAQVNADWNATSGAGQILNKPEIPTVPTNVSAFTNDANYITSADVPAQVNADWNATSGAGQILNKPAIPTVPTNVSAFANDANYITSADVPAQVNADWNATIGAGQILNKPELFSGNYNDLTNRPEIPTVPTNVSAFTNDANYITSADVPAQVNADWNATSGAGQILNKPEIPTVPTNVSAFTNDANYITSADVPAQVNADWNATSGAGQILNKPELFSGNYNDLTNKPAIPTVPTNVSAFTNDANYITSADVPAQVNADWNATSGAGQILNKPELFSGDYNDLANIPEIPTVPTNISAFANDANYITSADVPVQVNADWNATSGAGQILNKPEFFDGNYNNLTNTPDLSGYITTETQTIADAAALGNSVNTQLKNVSDPTENQDAVTKAYVDRIISQMQFIIDSLSSVLNSVTFAHETFIEDLDFKLGFYDERDGNHYNMVKIGEQIWMAENLRYEGNSSLKTGTTDLTTSSIVRYHYYPNSNNVYGFGYIYNWAAAMNGASSSSSNPSGIQGICPNGWHLPSDAEWTQLTDYLSSHNEYLCGDDPSNISKSLASTTGWNSSTVTCSPGNTPSLNNLSGFNAQPAGKLSCTTTYNNGTTTYNYHISGAGSFASFWSATKSDNDEVHCRQIVNYNSTYFNSTSKTNLGNSVRCVKD